MKILIGCVSFIIVFCFGACSLFDNPHEQTQINVENEFKLELSQILGPGPNPLEIVVSTLAPPQCKDSEIRILKSQDIDMLFLGILDVFNPNSCEITNQLISGSAIYDLNNGTYDFTLDLNASLTNRLDNSITNMGSLEVTEESYNLSLETQNGFQLGLLQIRQIPDELFWGYLTVNKEQDIVLFDEFKNHLNTHIDENHGLSKGNYTYFSITDNLDFSFPLVEKPSFIQYFIYRSTTEPTELVLLFDEFRNMHSKISIFAQHSEGREL